MVLPASSGWWSNTVSEIWRLGGGRYSSQVMMWMGPLSRVARGSHEEGDIGAKAAAVGWVGDSPHTLWAEDSLSPVWPEDKRAGKAWVSLCCTAPLPTLNQLLALLAGLSFMGVRVNSI